MFRKVLREKSISQAPIPTVDRQPGSVQLNSPIWPTHLTACVLNLMPNDLRHVKLFDGTDSGYRFFV